MKRFISLAEAEAYIRGKRVAVVGSAPSVLENKAGFIDSHDVVVRANNYKLGDFAGTRTDVHYSFYGSSIRKSSADLKADGVKLCWCKCPNSKPIESEWHEKKGKQIGIDFRYIYQMRRDWWFCDTYIPDDYSFRRKFALLGNHIPTTGFSAILDVVEAGPESIYLTGFDFFSSGVHNINEPWRKGDPEDIIGHTPEGEARWIRENAAALNIALDPTLARIVKEGIAV